MIAPGLVDVEVVMKEVKEDEELQKIIAILKTNPEGKSRNHGLITSCYKERLC